MTLRTFYIMAPLAVLVAQAAVPAAPRAQSPRQRVRMDQGWRFHFGDLPFGNVGSAVTAWRWRADDQGPNDAEQMAVPALDTSGAGWQDARTGDDTFHGRLGFSWYRTSLVTPPGAKADARYILHFEGVDDNATVYLNGEKLLAHQGWDDPFDVPLSNAWKTGGPNDLAVLVENTAGMGGIIGPVSLEIANSAVATGAAAVKFDDRSWKQVSVPHDFVVEQPFDQTADRNHGYHPVGVGWYRKDLTIPASDRGKTLWLEFEGVYRNSTVWLNGQMLGHHASGYTSFYYDISQAANYGGKNVLTVRADARQFEGWWYEGGGIYRHVWLSSMSPVHVDHWGTFVQSKVVNGDQGGHDAADVTIETQVASALKANTNCQVVSELVGPTGVVAATMTSDLAVPGGGVGSVTQTEHVVQPRLWSLETPNLYRLHTLITQGQKTLDEYDTPFGIRTIRFDPDKGFFLNGQHVKIQGTCNHQDFAGIGIALPDRVHIYKIEKLKEMGSNGYRCSHHPYAPELMDACDRLGMLVMDENRRLGDTPEILSQVQSMVMRDRNHPSVIMWSMCNEEGLQGTQQGAAMFSAMKDEVHKCDTTRPVSCAMNGGWGTGISLVEDLQGCNYNPGGYDAFHQKFPNQPMFGSETASTVTDRGIYATDKEHGYVSAYNATDGSWKPVADRAFMAGSFAWTGFDYRGEPSPYDWPCINSHFGIMDTCGFPKDNYYYYASWWKTKPIVHIMPRWNWPGKEGQDIDVRCFSNCERVELFLNGKSLGAQDMPRNEHLDWKVPYQPGTLLAVGTNAGTEAAHDQVETTDAPAQVELAPDRTRILADDEDVSVVAVSIHDAKGRVVPTASNMVTFKVTGPARIDGVGNGDPSCHEPDKASQRSAFNGYCLVIVQATDNAGKITLTAESPGLKPATVTLQSAKNGVSLD